MLQIVLAKARQPRRRWPRSRSGIRLECHRQGSPSAARTSPPRRHPSGATSPPHRLREWRQPAFDASRGQGGAPQPRRPIRSSALRAYSNHEDEAWHSSFTKRRICPRRPGKIGRARDTQMLGPPSVKDVRRRLAQRPATACEAVGARRIAVWRRKFTPVPKPTPRQP